MNFQKSFVFLFVFVFFLSSTLTAVVFILILTSFYVLFLKSKKNATLHFCVILFFFVNEYSSFLFFHEINPNRFNSTIVTNYDFSYISNIKYDFKRIQTLASFIFTKTNNSLVGGYFDILYVNNVNIAESSYIFYDLLTSNIAAFFKNFFYLFMISLFFLVYFLFFFIKNETSKVV
jgi:hypothetical protein